MQRVTHGEGRDIDIPVHNFSETHYTASTFVDGTYNGRPALRPTVALVRATIEHGSQAPRTAWG